MAHGVRVRFFAQAREAVGARELLRPLPKGRGSVAAVLRDLTREFPRLAPVLRSCRFVRNGEYVPDRSTNLADGDELGIHPPYSGG